jgi:hypothetical protein
LELFSLEEKAALLPGGLFVYKVERDLRKRISSPGGLNGANPFVVVSEAKDLCISWTPGEFVNFFATPE